MELRLLATPDPSRRRAAGDADLHQPLGQQSRFHAHSISGPGAAGEIELKPHETKVVTLVPRAGNYHAHCSHFFHQSLGMSDEIVVD